MKIKVSLIIATFNRDRELIQVIKSLYKQKFSSFELIIVDQSKKHSPSTEVFLNKINYNNFRYFKVTPPSLPAARNFGIEKSQGRIVIFIDDDVILHSGFINEHFKSYNNPKVDAVAGRVIIKNQPESKTLLKITPKESFNLGGLDFPKTTFIDSGQGCNMSFRKKILEKMRGFDTNFIKNAYREETDLFFRLKKNNFKTLYNSRALLTHLLSPTGGCRVKSKTVFDDYIYYRNETLFFLKNQSLKYFPYFLYRQFRTHVSKRDSITEWILSTKLKAYLKGVFLGGLNFLFPKPQIHQKTF